MLVPRIVAATTIAAAVAGFAVVGCGGDGTSPDDGAGTPATLHAVTATNLSAPVGSVVAVSVAVHDARDTPVKGVTVAFSVGKGGGTVSPASATTDGNGVASASWKLGAQVGQNELRATVAPLQPVVFTATGQEAPPPPALQLVVLPSLGGGSEVWGINEDGTIIVGDSQDPATGRIWAVVWTQTGGVDTWSIAKLAAHTDDVLGKGIDNAGNAVGYALTQRVGLFWPVGGGGPTALGCSGDGQAQVLGISARGQVVVGARTGQVPLTASVWRPGSCRVSLPALYANGPTISLAANTDGTIVVGRAAPSSATDINDGVAVRWRDGAGQWSVEQIDSRVSTASGVNATGDVVGSVWVACATAAGCSRPVIWYANGSVRQLGTLGADALGQARAVGLDINSAGEVVGWSQESEGGGAALIPFIWSEPLGMRALPSEGSSLGVAVSDVRGDGTRLVAGTLLGGAGVDARAAVWVVRNP